MTYVRERKVINLAFDDDHQFAGLHIRTRSLSTGALLEVLELYQLIGKKPDDLTPDDLAGIGRLFERFAAALISWDLKEEAAEEGQPAVPVPATVEGVKGQDPEFMFALIGEWAGSVGGISRELGKDLTSGRPYPEGSTTTESQLASLSNSLTPS